MNTRIVDGRLTRDAEVKQNSSKGKPFLSFVLANNSFFNGSAVTTFFNVITYNEHYIENASQFTKGKYIMVQGMSNEVMTIKDNKTYLNRNIIAYHIDAYSNNQDKNKDKTQVYHDVAPSTPTCEKPELPSVEAPLPYVQTTAQITPKINKQDSVFEPSINNNANLDYELPF